MGIAQMLPDGAKNTYDFVVGQGYGKPATRRLPYNDFGLVSTTRSPAADRCSQSAPHRTMARLPASKWAGSSSST